MRTQRYTWQDIVTEAEALGLIKKGEANLAHALARAINWEPTEKNKPSGLYWANELAADVVGVPRATFFRNIKGLKAAGFFKEVKGNLLPVYPADTSKIRAAYEERQKALVDAWTARKSQNETSQSQNDTDESQNETAQSQNDNPYSVDTYTPKVSTGNASTVDVLPTVPSGPVVNDSETSSNKKSPFAYIVRETPRNSANHKTYRNGFYFLNLEEWVPGLSGVEKPRQSQNETRDDFWSQEAVQARIAGIGGGSGVNTMEMDW